NCNTTSNGIICSLGSLANGASATITLATRANAAGTFVATATVAGNEAETDPADNQARQTTSVIVPGFEATNLATITIADRSATGPGKATPYPSTIVVSGLTGTVYKVTATLNNLSHGAAADLDVLLVGPKGQSVLLMSDAAAGFVVSGVSLTFDDDA